MSNGIRCMLMRGGSSKGAYFVAEDLPADPADRDALLLRVMGSPDPRQIDGVGGAHPLTSKVAIVSASGHADADVDFLFAQVGVHQAIVDTTPNCGNILAGVGPFAIERGIVSVAGMVTPVRVRILNTGTRAELVVSTPKGSVEYDGDEAIDGVPGTAAPIPINLLDTEGSVCGALFPTGKRTDSIQGFEVTCIDNGMPVILMRATDLGLSGHESCAELEAATEVLTLLEQVRLHAGPHMRLGDVADAAVPKICLLSSPLSDGCIDTRCFIPKRCHTSIGVFAAVTVATACVLPGTIAHTVAVLPEGDVQTLIVEHPSGSFPVRLELTGPADNPRVLRGGIMRTARALFDGVVFPRGKGGRSAESTFNH